MGSVLKWRKKKMRKHKYKKLRRRTRHQRRK
ncbi:MAG TPA: AURKAIP1/COX24 domain-containing protein [Deltaproteobacteria bacterium]|nr:AURKAIP1/COX24 domain-containing protein [Deltaproteobacteria bacterium]